MANTARVRLRQGESERVKHSLDGDDILVNPRFDSCVCEGRRGGGEGGDGGEGGESVKHSNQIDMHAIVFLSTRAFKRVPISQARLNMQKIGHLRTNVISVKRIHQLKGP